MIVRGESTIIDYHTPFDQGFTEMDSISAGLSCLVNVPPRELRERSAVLEQRLVMEPDV